MKKVLITLTLFIVNYSLFIDLPAVKLCGKWVSSPCTYGAIGDGNVLCNTGDNCCYCLLGGCGIVAYWEMIGFADCKSQNGLAICYNACALTTRTTTIASFPNAAAVTCPISGECEDTNYKTVGDSESCGNGWDETTSPALTISGEYSDDAGTFIYGECAK